MTKEKAFEIIRYNIGRGINKKWIGIKIYGKATVYCLSRAKPKTADHVYPIGTYRQNKIAAKKLAYYINNGGAA